MEAGGLAVTYTAEMPPFSFVFFSNKYLFLSTRQEKKPCFLLLFTLLPSLFDFWWCSCLLDLGLSCFQMSWGYWGPVDERWPFPWGCSAQSTVSFAEACKAQRAVARYCVRGRRADAGEQRGPWTRQEQSSSKSQLVYETLWALPVKTASFYWFLWRLLRAQRNSVQRAKMVRCFVLAREK